MTSNTPRPLSPRPSAEHLRKQAKRLAKDQAIQLAAAQLRLAAEYGFPSWAALMRAVEVAGADAPPAHPDEHLHAALWLACKEDGPAERRLEFARVLLERGASPRQAFEGGATALHQAARNGPLAMVELLIRHGGKTWQGDAEGRSALDYAREASSQDREAIVELLDRPVIRDADFKAAVQAIHAGDAVGLAKLLDRRPELLHMRAVEPDCYPKSDYFTDPKLFWFVANNPNLIPRAPANICGVAQLMIDRGVEQEDLDYAFELVVTGLDEKLGGQQGALARLLIGGGAAVNPKSLGFALAEGADRLVSSLVRSGASLTAPLAAGLGELDALARLLPDAAPDELHGAFSLAVIKRRLEAARACLAAGADVNAPLAVHRHSTALHQAAINGDLPMIELLLDAGARQDVRDTLWDGTPLGWAVHGQQAAAEALLRARSPPA